MVFEKFTGKGEKAPEESESEWMELDSASFNENTNINVCVETLESFGDTSRIQNLLREGKIVFLKIRDLRQKNITELKRAVEKLKKTCVAMEGDIVGVDEDFLVMTPDFAKIWRGN